MSTNGITSWAVDMKDVAAIYPFQGAEVLMVILGLVFWIGFHVLQIRQERQEVKREMEADVGGELTRETIDRY